MANEYAISWGSIGSNAQTLQSSNQFQYTDEIHITHTPGHPFPNPMTLEFVIGDTTSIATEAFDSMVIEPGRTFTYVTPYTLTANKLFSQNTDTSVLKVYARLKTLYGAFYSEIKTITLDAPPVIVNPTFTSNFSDTSVFIEGITSLTARCRTIGQFGATFGAQTGMTLIINNGSTVGSVYMLQDDDGWYRTLNSLSAGNYNFGLRATDSRGAVTIYSATVPVKAHTAPNLSYEVFRCDANGDRDMSGAYISVTAWSKATPSELGIASITVQGIETGTTTEIIPQTALTEGVASVFGGTLSPDKSYTLTITTTDDAGTYGATAQTATQEVVVPKVVRVINVKEGGTGLAFGQRSTKDSIVDSAWEIDAPIVRPASLTNFYPSENAVSGSWAALRCTATLTETPTVRTNADKTVIFISGRMRLTNFTKSDANPGLTVNTTLRPSERITFDCGVRFTNGTTAAPEKMQAILNTQGVLNLYTTESISNIPNGNYYALFFSVLLPII